MHPCCQKCGKEMLIKNHREIPQCRCKTAATPKAPQNRMTNNQKRKIKRGDFKWPIAFHERPQWAKVF